MKKRTTLLNILAMLLVFGGFEQSLQASMKHHIDPSLISRHRKKAKCCKGTNDGKFCDGVRGDKRSLSPWISVKDNLFVYKFNVFNLDPARVDQKTLKSILDANVKDIADNYAKDWGAKIDVRLYTAADLTNPKLFKGDRIPFFVGDFSQPGALGFHCVQVLNPVVNENSFIVGGCNIQDGLGITIANNLPDYTPYGVAFTSLETFIERNIANNNPYAPQDLHQALSIVINHELKEILGDDSVGNLEQFDTYAPAVANWHWAEFARGEIQNGTVGPDGYVRLPFFNDVFPEGGIFFTALENADAVGRGRANILNGYKVCGWYMTNYPTTNFWKSYYTSDEIKWDKKGYVENPEQPFAAISSIYFLDYATGTTYYGSIQNWGPVTVAQRGDPLTNNFPPDYTYVSFNFNFNPAPTVDGVSKNTKENGSLIKPATDGKKVFDK